MPNTSLHRRIRFASRSLGILAAAGAATVFAAGCADLQADAEGQAQETGQGVEDRIEARTASTEERVNQRTQETQDRADQRVSETVDRADKKIEGAVDRGLNKLFGDD